MSASKILSGVRIDGKLSGSSDIKVEGEIYGEIDLESSIYIAEGGKTKANIKAVNVFIAGDFEGDIDAEFVQISPTGRCKGFLRAPAVSIEKGAKFSGSLEMGDDSCAEDSDEAPAEKKAVAPAASGFDETAEEKPDGDEKK